MAFPTLTLQLDTGDPTVSSPTWTDITDYIGRGGIRVTHGRQFELDKIEAGTSDVELDNLDRRFDPTFTHGAYYPNVKPMRRLQLKAVWNSVTYYVFTHYVERWPPTWEGPDDATVTITASDGFTVLNRAALTLTRSAELSSVRVGAVLDAIGWPAGARTIATGQTTVPACAFADADGMDALTHIQNVATAEDGLFFIDGAGNAVFQDRTLRLKATTSQVTLTDDDTAAAASVLPYDDAVTSYDLDHLYNEIKGQRDTGTVQVASDSSSQTSYYRRTLLEQSLLITTDAEVLSRAQFRLSRYKDPALRVDQVTLRPAGSDTVAAYYWPHLLGREISDRITFNRTPALHPSGTVEQISIGCFIESVEHEFVPPNDWKTTYLLSPAGVQTYWILEDAVASILDTSTRLGY